ncbi:MAG: hypothetical protein HOO96_01250 [Polyangiaceae bacterium]|nr:hypothetical protein [Polyangiaceae bacterium]
MVFVYLAAMTGLTGCGYTYHFRDATTVRGEEHNEWASYFVFGVVGDYEIDVREVCPAGVHEITTGNNFATWLLRVVTIGIYTPRKVNIWCSGGRTTASAVTERKTDGGTPEATRAPALGVNASPTGPQRSAGAR